MKEQTKGDLAIAAIIIIVIAFLVGGVFVQPYMESKTYNKLTGAKTTWWDALWVELRVQDNPK